MNLEHTELKCQIPCLRSLAEGQAQAPAEPLGRRIKLMIRRRLSPSQERAFKRYTNDILNRIYTLIGKTPKPSVSPAKIPAPQFQEGDRVRVRPLKEIQATLNQWSQLKGCTFMAEMGKYCETSQRILRPMKRFVDERDLRVKKTSGIILLEGVLCQGTAEFGSCDRSCFLFWREEWLEKLD